SLLCSKLSTETVPSEAAALQAEEAFGRLNQCEIGRDTFGEKVEILSRLAFEAWRHFRMTRGGSAAHEWVERCDEIVSGGCVNVECLDYFIQAPGKRRASLNRAFLDDAGTLFLVCSLARVRRNVNPRRLLESLQPIYDWVRESYWPVSFLD